MTRPNVLTSPVYPEPSKSEAEAITVVDCAGDSVGGFRRYLDELQEWLGRRAAPICLTGQGVRLGARWLLWRELHTARRRPRHVVALNNVSFVAAGHVRTVLLRNAIHFLGPGELEDRRSRLRSEIAKGPIVRAALRRADRIIVPSETMADRVEAFCPTARERLEVLPHPVRPLASGDRVCGTEDRILCPVVDGPHKRLDRWLMEAITVLNDTTRRRARPIRLEVTMAVREARRQGLPLHPWITYLGLISTEEMREHQHAARAIFYPVEVESFGYPLAEARVNRQPVVAPDVPLCREVAGDALAGYRQGDRESLRDAFMTALQVTLPPLQRNPFDPEVYFDRIFNPDTL